MNAFSLREIAVLDAIRRSSSLTSAAALLGSSQPAMSRAVKEIEARIGLCLFRRQRGRLEPTPEALALFRSIEQISSAVGNLSRQVTELRDGSSGRIIVSTGHSLASSVVSRSVEEFRRTRANVAVEIKECTTASVIEDVRLQKSDIGLVYAPVNHAAIRSSVVSQSVLTCIMPANHPLATSTFITPKMLKEELVVTFRDDTLIYTLLAMAFSKEGYPPPSRTMVTSANTAYNFAQLLGAIAIVDPFLIATGAFPMLTARRFRPEIPIGIRTLVNRDAQLSKPAMTLLSIMHSVSERVSHEVMNMQESSPAPAGRSA